MGTTSVDGLGPEFSSYSDEHLDSVLRRAEMDLQLSRNDPQRRRRIQAVFEAAAAERERRLEKRTSQP